MKEDKFIHHLLRNSRLIGIPLTFIGLVGYTDNRLEKISSRLEEFSNGIEEITGQKKAVLYEETLIVQKVYSDENLIFEPGEYLTIVVSNTKDKSSIPSRTLVKASQMGNQLPEPGDTLKYRALGLRTPFAGVRDIERQYELHKRNL